MSCELLTREFETLAGEKKLFATRQLPADKSLDFHVELVGKLGSSCFPLIDNKYNFGDLMAVMRANEHPAVADFIKRTVCFAACEGQEIKPHNINLLFNGELMMMLKVFAFVLEANYKAFFKQGLEMNEQRRLEAEELLAQDPQKNSSPKT